MKLGNLLKAITLKLTKNGKRIFLYAVMHSKLEHVIYVSQIQNTELIK